MQISEFIKALEAMQSSNMNIDSISFTVNFSNNSKPINMESGLLETQPKPKLEIPQEMLQEEF